MARSTHVLLLEGVPRPPIPHEDDKRCRTHEATKFSHRSRRNEGLKSISDDNMGAARRLVGLGDSGPAKRNVRELEQADFAFDQQHLSQ
ncbi:hypothetical protein E4U55_000756 [Claviceps digitariae]|nr:hypothetical protein E4U55_000756 [Claviceps digitariae]